MRELGLWAVGTKPNTSKPRPEHQVYPYLLRGLVIDRPYQVWATDITYIRMRHGFLHLCAILDWATWKVLAWRLSGTSLNLCHSGGCPSYRDYRTAQCR